MVQTKTGAGENPWLSYMRVCAANYKAGAQSKGAGGANPAKPRTRITGKTPDPQAKEKPARPMTEKDTQTHKVVKANGKAEAKKKAKEKKQAQNEIDGNG
jgi:hypothetical protein